MTFRIGMKVARFRFPHDATDFSREHTPIGRALTIRDIDFRAVNAGLFDFDAPTIRFEEIVRAVDDTCVGRWECGFAPYNFRPLIERSTDAAVEQLRKLQDPKHHTLLPEDELERELLEVINEALR